MLKIIEVHTGSRTQGEYIVLQNQGLMTVNLRGWTLCSDAFLSGETARALEEMYIFQEEILVKPYMRVVLFTGDGEDGWVPTIDGKQAYCAYWNRTDRVWSRTAQVHLLHLLQSRKIVPAFPPSLIATN